MQASKASITSCISPASCLLVTLFALCCPYSVAAVPVYLHNVISLANGRWINTNKRQQQLETSGFQILCCETVCHTCCITSLCYLGDVIMVNCYHGTSRSPDDAHLLRFHLRRWCGLSEAFTSWSAAASFLCFRNMWTGSSSFSLSAYRNDTKYLSCESWSVCSRF